VHSLPHLFHNRNTYSCSSSQANKPAATSTQISTHQNVQKPPQKLVPSTLDENQDDIYASDTEDNIPMALAQEEKKIGEEEKESSEQRDKNKEKEKEKEEQPKIPQKRKNVGAGHGSKSM
jgi:hypothetical protein